MKLTTPTTRRAPRSRAARVPAFVMAAALAAAGVAVAPGVARASTPLSTQTFTRPGTYTVTVPDNATTVQVVGLGGAGQGGGSAPEGYGAGGAGGHGTQVSEYLAVGPDQVITPGSTLTVTVGAVGGGGPGGSPQYALGHAEGGLGGAGGGATTITTGGGHFVLVAGGGGGGGGGGNGHSGGDGGTNGDGQSTSLDGVIAARAGAYGGSCSLLQVALGEAGESNGTTFNLGGGGGGGGRGCTAGGGGGSGDHGSGRTADGTGGGGGGAGGSVGVDSYATITAGTNTGSGSASITFSVPSTGEGPYATTLTVNPDQVRLGSDATITATPVLDGTGAPLGYGDNFIQVIGPDNKNHVDCDGVTTCVFRTGSPVEGPLTPGIYRVEDLFRRYYNLPVQLIATTSLVVLPALAATTTTLTTPAALTSGGGTLRATVAPGSTDQLIPTGAVTFADGTTPLCGGPVDLTGETPDGTGSYADCRLDAVAPGPHHYSVSYSGDSHFAGSTDELDSTIAAATSVTLASSANPAQAGQPVTFTATVGPAGTTATGTVTFTDGSTTLADEPLTTGGTAAYTTSTLPAGPHLITATYSGDGSHAGATSNPLTEQVTAAPTAPSAPHLDATDPASGQVRVAFTPPTDTGGAAITGYTVTASPGGRTATGSTGPITVSGLTNGTAYTFTVTATNAAGLTSLPSAASAPVTPAAPPVNPTAPLSITTTALPAGTVGSPYPATLSASGGTSPYRWTPASGSRLPAGLTLHRNGTIDGTPRAASTRTVKVQVTDAGTPRQTAVRTLTLVVAPASTRTSLSASADPALRRQPITLTARVTVPAGAPRPAGRVRFADGSTTLGTVGLNRSGVATYTTSSLAVGAHPLTATYVGTPAERGSTSAPLTEVVEQVTPAALAAQAARYVQGSPAYARLCPAWRRAALARITWATQELARPAGRHHARQQWALITVFDAAVGAAEARHYLTAAQAAALIGEATAL